MIELNAEQREAMARGLPVWIVEPETQDTYVLFRDADYARLEGPLPRPVENPPPGISPMVLRSMLAFWCNLSDLLRDRRNRGKWAAYHGEERVAITRSESGAYQECFRRGLKSGEFYVGSMREDPEGMPPWAAIEAARTFNGATENDPLDDA
jgi:hypothetical protein